MSMVLFFMKHTDEEGDYIFTDTDRKLANRFFGFSYLGLLVVFFIIILAPSCPDHPRTAEDFFKVGNDCVAGGYYVEAQSSFTRAIKLNPSYFEAYQARAKAWESSDSLRRAIRDYDSLLTFKTLTVIQKANFYYIKANLYHQLSEDTISCKNLREACNLNHNKSCDEIRKRCK